MTLYLKYRPQKIEELDLVSVRSRLSTILSSGKIPHAFLFCGSKGTGKTSSARILAKAINCVGKRDGFEPCGNCDQCRTITTGSNLDVIEMDAASNRGIDDVRSLRENVKLSPASARKKIYIIDEAHMLTSEAANALLKTLEEPPSHVLFILATTNPEKLPSTIQSRLTVVTFPKAKQEEIIQKLKKIAKGEELEVEEDVYALIAKASDGSFRDAVKHIETLAGFNLPITLELAKSELFSGNILQTQTLLHYLDEGEIEKALVEVERVANEGGSIKAYIDELIITLHNELLGNFGIGVTQPGMKTESINSLLPLLIEAKNDMGTGPIPQLSLELAIIKWCKNKAPIQQVTEKVSLKVETETQIAVNESKKEESLAPNTADVAEPKSGEEVNVDTWKKVLADLKTKNASIEALLRAARPTSFDGSNLTLAVYYKFHKERLEVGSNMTVLEEVIESVFGKKVRVNCELTPKPNTQSRREVVLAEPGEDIVNAAKEIFGA